MFAAIYKVDEETRTVTGRATQEVVDKDGEVMDYASTKPNFMSWSAEVFNDTAGKSHGNLRAMHGNVAAGKVTDIDFNDVEKAIDITAKIVDDNEWSKVLEGVYAGFSIGGRYSRKWADAIDGKVVQRYTAVPSEISIVDRPCVPTAKFFSVHKKGGGIVQKRFKNSGNYKSDIQFAGGKVTLRGGNDIAAIRKAHASGPMRMGGDFMDGRFAKDNAVGSDPTVKAIRKAHGRPLAGNGIFGPLDLNKAFSNRTLRKGSFPTESSNGNWDSKVADTGASNDWKDQKWNPPKPSIVGGQVVTDVSRSPNIAAVLAALKEDFARGAKRLM